MYTMIHNLLADRSGDVLFTCFGAWHIGYLLLIFILIGICCRYVSSLEPHRKQKFLDRSSEAAFGVYILDFFLMPLAYGYLDVEKLPFHVCTAMCVSGFLSCKSTPLKKYAPQDP